MHEHEEIIHVKPIDYYENHSNQAMLITVRTGVIMKTYEIKPGEEIKFRSGYSSISVHPVERPLKESLNSRIKKRKFQKTKQNVSLFR